MGILKAYARRKADKRSRALMKRSLVARTFGPELKELTDEDLMERAQKAFSDKCPNEAEALALGREAVRRAEGIELTDEQLACALALVDGDVAEASTGSGKTLAAMPAAFILAARFGQCHVATVNEYLAGRDAMEAERVLGYLGVTVASTLAGDSAEAKHKAYHADVVYGQASEFGFDYLRDGMARRAADLVQTGLHACIIDECDSVLIDDARTPLIISGANEHSVEEAKLVAASVRGLEVDTDIKLDEAERTAVLTESGEYLVELHLPWKIRSTPGHANLVKQALIAEYLYKRDRDYIVRAGKVEIVDEQTGRVMEGRRWSDGLHAAVEAKEGVEVEPETTTMASVSYQNFFRMYEHLSGMTGTAASEDAEFMRVFGMGVSIIPDHVPSKRIDLDDVFFATSEGRMEAVVADIAERHARKQPVLVGTQSVEESEVLAAALKDAGIDAVVLNARDNTAEAAIVAAAGKPGRVTVSTNMAGRGTDIKLGGSPEWDADATLRALGSSLTSVSPDEREHRVAAARKRCDAMRDEVIKAGGLAVVSVGRNKNRRIDDQLRGRSGRQGDIGSSQFFVSFEDDLLRNFNADAVEKAKRSIEKSGGKMTSKVVSGLVEGAQERISERDAEARRAMLDYDDVTSAQARRMRDWRRPLLNEDEDSLKMVRELAEKALDAHASDMEAVAEACRVTLADNQDARTAIENRIENRIEACRDAAASVMSQITLYVADRAWADHLTDEDLLRNNISLMGLAGRDPLVEYKSESAHLEELMMADIAERTLKRICTADIRRATERRVQGGREEATRRRIAESGLVNAMAPMATTGASTVPQNRAQRRAAAKHKRVKR